MDSFMKLINYLPWIVTVIILGSIVLPQAVRILREYERGSSSASAGCAARKGRD